MKSVICLALTSGFLLAWTVPAMMVDEHLAKIEPMNVQGRQGWQIRQVITIGEYRSGPVKRSWTKGYDYPFIIRFTAAKEKLGFDTVDGFGRRARAFCAGKLSEQDFHKFNQYFDVNLRTRDVFSCTVAIGEAQTYDFFVHDLNQNSTSGTVNGSLRGAERDIAIRPVWHLATGKKTWDVRPLGLEFVDGRTVVGAVELINGGRVWLDPDLSEEHKLVLASLASALLLRSDLADHND